MLPTNIWPTQCDLLLWVGLSRTKKGRHPVFKRGCQHSNKCWILRSKWCSHCKPFLKKEMQTKPTRTAISFSSKLWRERLGAEQTLLDLEKRNCMRNNHPKEKSWLTLRLFICSLSKHAHWSLNSWSQVFCKEVGPESPPFITTEINPFPCMKWCMFFQLSKATVYCFFISFPLNSWLSGCSVSILNTPENETYKLWFCSWPRSEQCRSIKVIPWTTGHIYQHLLWAALGDARWGSTDSAELETKTFFKCGLCRGTNTFIPGPVTHIQLRKWHWDSMIIFSIKGCISEEKYFTVFIIRMIKYCGVYISSASLCLTTETNNEVVCWEYSEYED